jgi:hypothetical protein
MTVVALIAEAVMTVKENYLLGKYRPLLDEHISQKYGQLLAIG